MYARWHVHLAAPTMGLRQTCSCPIVHMHHTEEPVHKLLAAALAGSATHLQAGRVVTGSCNAAGKHVTCVCARTVLKPINLSTTRVGPSGCCTTEIEQRSNTQKTSSTRTEQKVAAHTKSTLLARLDQLACIRMHSFRQQTQALRAQPPPAPNATANATVSRAPCGHTGSPHTEALLKATSPRFYAAALLAAFE